MLKRCLAVVIMAAMLAVPLPGAVRADNNDHDNERNEQRDTKSHNELRSYNYLPLTLANQVQLRIALVVLMTQSLTYNLLMASGVDVTDQNRIGLGGLFGGIFAKTYSAEDFVKSLEVGSVYRGGDDKIVLALKGERRLEDYRVVVFNGDYQYDPRARPKVQQVDPATLAALGTIPVVNSMLLHSLAPNAAEMVADPDQDPPSLADLGVEVLDQAPRLRELRIGKVYIAGNDTLLVVIPPAIVLRR